MLRVPYDATTEEEVVQYFKTRQLQLASIGFSWDGKLKKNTYGYSVRYKEETTGMEYDGFYVLKQHRGQGYSKKLVESLGTVITIKDCGVVDFLSKIEKEHRVVSGPFDMLEYKMVEKFYDDGRANRSKVWFMNHIDEGMIILEKLGKTKASQAGFCLHPLTQDDGNLAKTFAMLSKEGTPYHVGLSLEYRNIANAYLSKREINSIDEIHLSPLQEVNDMLIADKIQNYKDFLLYHRGTHPRSKELEHYFNNWLEKLNCREQFEWFIQYSKQFEKQIEIIES